METNPLPTADAEAVRALDEYVDAVRRLDKWHGEQVLHLVRLYRDELPGGLQRALERLDEQW